MIGDSLIYNNLIYVAARQVMSVNWGSLHLRLLLSPPQNRGNLPFIQKAFGPRAQNNASKRGISNSKRVSHETLMFLM